MSDQIVRMLVLIIRHYISYKHGQLQATVDALDRMDLRDERDFRYARQQREWRRYAMAGLKKAYADCTERNLSRLLREWGFTDESAIRGAVAAEPNRSVLPFPKPAT